MNAAAAVALAASSAESCEEANRDDPSAGENALPSCEVVVLEKDGHDVDFKIDVANSMGTGYAVTYDAQWDFGDGTTEEGDRRISHQYSGFGPYPVNATIDVDVDTGMWKEGEGPSEQLDCKQTEVSFPI